MNNIQFSREEIIKLLSEIDGTHWLNDRLVNSLNSNVVPAVKLPELSSYPRGAEINLNHIVKKAEEPAMTIEKAFAAVEMDIDMKYSVNKISKVTGCKWETYGNYCNRENIVGAEYCAKHNGETCRYCNNQTTHGCPEEMQFVCGEYLCDNHRHNGIIINQRF